MKKIDLKKQWNFLYVPSSRRPEIVTVPAFKFLVLDGTLAPGEAPASSQSFQDAIGALYAAAYTLKFMSRLRAKNPVDYPVMALEGLWWTDSGRFEISRQTEPWHWRLMLMQPGHITTPMLRTAITRIEQKKPNPALRQLRLTSFREGRVVQMMHVGPYAEEPRTVSAIEAFATGAGYRLSGKHHEVYLGNPRRAKPDRLRTVVRYPVRKSGSRPA